MYNILYSFVVFLVDFIEFDYYPTVAFPIIDDFYWDTYDFEGETYYLVDDTINEADQEHEGKRWGIGAYGDPDDDGMFDCVILLFNEEEDTVVDIMDTDEMLNNEGELE